jgi:hypothetical protein
MHLQFVETESTFDYFEATRASLDRYGKPIAFYSDKHAVFRVNKKDCGGRRWNDPVRAGSACAQHRHHLCQFLAGQGPRGACERDVTGPLVKEMRLRSIDAVAAANAFLPTFMADYNTRFAKAPFDERDLHRPLVGDDGRKIAQSPKI